jgi:hypothetical protein
VETPVSNFAFEFNLYRYISSLASSSSQQLFSGAVCSALPSRLLSIRMGSAGVKGTLPSCLLAHNLHELQLQDNRLTGEAVQVDP